MGKGVVVEIVRSKLVLKDVFAVLIYMNVHVSFFVSI